MINTRPNDDVASSSFIRKFRVQIGNSTIFVDVDGLTHKEWLKGRATMLNFARAVCLAIKRDDRVALRNTFNALQVRTKSEILLPCLCYAIEVGSADCVQEMLDHGVPIERPINHTDGVGESSSTVLGISAIKLNKSSGLERDRRCQVILALLAAGGDLNAPMEFRRGSAYAQYSVKEYLELIGLWGLIEALQEDVCLSEIVRPDSGRENTPTPIRI